MELRTMPMHIDAIAMVHMAGLAKTLRKTKPSVALAAASSFVSSAVWNSKPTSPGELATYFKFTKNKMAMIAAGLQKQDCTEKKRRMEGDKKETKRRGARDR